MDTTFTIDSWENLKKYTAARIALGRAGSSVPTHELLNFSAAHAQAKDAVYTTFNPQLYEEITLQTGLPLTKLKSKAIDRAMYVRRPDFGKLLNEESRTKLVKNTLDFDICVMIADGLSANAINQNCIEFLKIFLPICTKNGWRIPHLFTIEQGRVAIADEIGELVKAKLSVILIGERPGLSSPDSMGIYLTYKPLKGKTDETRNCISNIRAEGLDINFAAFKLAYLIKESLYKKITGVSLKDEYTQELYEMHQLNML